MNRSNHNLLKLLRKIVILILPILVFIVIYFLTDPLKVIYKYKEFKNSQIELNSGYVAWQTYLNNKDTVDYNSFILGNSCCMAFPTKLWDKYIHSNSSINLNANSESIYAIYKKLSRLDYYNENIDNVLIVVDNETLRRSTPSYSHTHILHKDLSNMSFFKFNFSIMKSLFRPKILISYIDYGIFGKIRKYMKGIITDKIDSRNNITNDIINPRELEIKKDSLNYWHIHQNEFPPKQPNKILSRSIHIEEIRLLNKIKDILQKHNTNFKIVISPEYRLIKLNPNDLNTLQEIFGKSNVYDFTGKNELTDKLEYYYEESHYRPVLGDILLRKIYHSENQ